jgi:RNA polymerase sigma-70 factor, ECF subfamily
LNDTDEQLMRRYRDGDLRAFDRLYERYRGPLYRYVRRLCGDGGSADELYQDVWMRLVAARQQWDATQAFSPWLYRIAHNRVVDHWRAAGRLLDEIEDADALPAQGPAQEVLAHLRDCVERLLALLGGLPALQRSAFLLKEEAGLSLAQIAEVTGSERETVKSRLRYALRRLRAGLEGCDE